MENKNIFYNKDSSFTFAYKANTVIDDNRDFLLHLHPYPEIYICMSGGANFIIEGTTFRLNPYDILIIPPYKLHRPKPKIGQFFERCLIHISPSFSEKLTFPQFENMFVSSPEFNYKIPGYSTYRTAVPTILKFIINNCMLDNPYTAPILLCKITELLFALNSINHFETFTSLNGIAQDIIDYIDTHPIDTLNTQDISSHFHYSNNYLNHIFKKNTGITIKKYINLKKMQKVIELHKKGLSLIHSCIEAGFANYEAFAYLYKKEFGILPKNDFFN